MNRLTLAPLLTTAVIFSSAIAAPPAETVDATTNKGLVEVQARKLLRDLTGAHESGKFTLKKCSRIPGKKWAALALSREPIVHELKFKPGCDAQGKLRITLEPFPVDLEVRGLADVKRVKGTGQITLVPRLMDQVLDIDVKFSEGRGLALPEREILALGATYGITLGLDGKLKNNRGGEVALSRYRGTAVAIREPLRFEVPQKAEKVSANKSATSQPVSKTSTKAPAQKSHSHSTTQASGSSKSPVQAPSSKPASKPAPRPTATKKSAGHP